jgi:hypothetical protein
MQALRSSSKATVARSSGRLQVSLRAQRVRPARAEEGRADAPTTEAVPPTQPAAATQQPPAAAAPAAPTAPIAVKGQGTAIITGAISLLFGVAYLVVTAILDMRGGGWAQQAWLITVPTAQPRPQPQHARTAAPPHSPARPCLRVCQLQHTP